MIVRGKIAVVTGGGQGIGKSIAESLGEEGARVIIADIDMKAAEAVAYKINEFGEAKAMKLDVSKKDDIERMVKKTIKEFGRIDILVNNAGILISSSAEEFALEHFKRVLNVNLTGTFLCCQAVGREMIKNRNGKIINIASAAAHCAAPNMLAYNVSKAGVIQLTKTFAIEWGKYNINVNSISPGITESEMLTRLRVEDPEAFMAREQKIPLKRINQPKDIAKLVLFLASPDSDNITGEDVLLDGGMLAIHPGLA